MAYKEEESGLSGVIQYAIYSRMGVTSVSTGSRPSTTLRHAYRIGQCALASPQLSTRTSYAANTRNLPVYEQRDHLPEPVAGGWWHLRDIARAQKVSAWGDASIWPRASRTVLWNAYLKGKATDGARGGGKAGRVPRLPGASTIP